MKALLIAVSATALVALEAAANILTISAAQGGAVAAGVNYVNFDDLALGSSTQTATGPNGSVLLTFDGPARVVQGDLDGVYLAPYLYNNQGAFFGGQPDGKDTTPYLATGFGGEVTIEFATPQKYLGLLWGTVDTFQEVHLFSNSLGRMGTVTGGNLLSLGTVAYPDGNRSAYVNINSELPFDFVVAGPFFFEFDNLAYFGETVTLPGKTLTLPLSPVPDAPSMSRMAAPARPCLVWPRLDASACEESWQGSD